MQRKTMIISLARLIDNVSGWKQGRDGDMSRCAAAGGKQHGHYDSTYGHLAAAMETLSAGSMAYYRDCGEWVRWDDGGALVNITAKVREPNVPPAVDDCDS